MSKSHNKSQKAKKMVRLSEAQLRQMLLVKQQELLARIRRERGGLREGAVELAEASLGDFADRPVLTPEAEIGYEVVDHRARMLAQIERLVPENPRAGLFASSSLHASHAERRQ